MSTVTIGENVRALNLVRTERIGAVTVYWNGISITSAADSGIDVAAYEDALFVLNVGTVLGQRASLLNSIYEADADDPSGSMAITSASFTTVDVNGDETTQLANLKVGDHKRYLWLRTEVQNAFAGSASTNEAATIDFSAQVMLNGSQSLPVSNTLIFDV
jgi:hypothetical protein